MAKHIEPRRRPFLCCGSADQAVSLKENTFCLERERQFSAVKAVSYDSTRITFLAVVFPSRILRHIAKVRDNLQFVCYCANHVI